MSTKAEEALKAELDLRKKEKSVTCKRLKEERKEYIRNIKVQSLKINIKVGNIILFTDNIGCQFFY
ncbi:hypothetical protein ACQKMI_12400 [Lysinibacillus sp. NPDC097214]|uniref:hypothetical protein n=1 Tax=Lysinibacillus sp. NPDC097214 TaxID=3390584 RepID=UPI003D05524D